MNIDFRFPSYVEKVLDLYEENGYKAFVVGGAARDIIMGKPPHDYDIATDADPDEGLAIFKTKDIKTIDTSARHGTIIAVVEGEQVEITTFRVDGDYNDNRHPDSVILTRDINEDVSRRDFTMNAIYIGKDLKPVDKFGGVDDISKKLIRAVGDPKKRFEEDALRILRALRFSSVLGFKIEESLKNAIFDCKELLHNISVERIREELYKIVTGKNATTVIRDYLEVFSLFVPELLRMRGFDQHSRYHDKDLLEHTLSVLDLVEPKEGNLCLAALLHDVGKPDVFVMDDEGYGHMKMHNIKSREITDDFLNRFKFSNADKKEISDLVFLHDVFPESKASVRKYLSKYTLDFMKKLASLQKADILSHSEYGKRRITLLEDREKIIEEIIANDECFNMKDLKIGGRDLIDMGIPEGPDVGRIMKDVFAKVLEGEIKNDRNELLLYVKSLI